MRTICILRRLRRNLACMPTTVYCRNQAIGQIRNCRFTPFRESQCSCS